MNLGDFLQTLNNICGKMDANPNFPGLQTAVSALTARKNEYVILAEQAMAGSKIDILARDAKRAELVTLMRNLGNEVNAVAAGDVVKLESSGYTVSKTRQPSKPLEKPTAPKLNAGVNIGEIKCAAKKQVGNEKISYMISTDPAVESSWKVFNSTRSKYVFTDLTSGQRYYIKYMLCGVREQEAISDTVSYIPQ